MQDQGDRWRRIGDAAKTKGRCYKNKGWWMGIESATLQRGGVAKGSGSVTVQKGKT